MRGSPLFRTLFVLVALIGAGFGFARLTASRAEARVTSPAGKSSAPIIQTATNFQLQLSASAREVRISSSEGEEHSFPDVSAPVSGRLVMDAGNPVIFLEIRWMDEAENGTHRFAKLTLESPGKPTFTHVFDATGDIDEILELPLP